MSKIITRTIRAPKRKSGRKPTNAERVMAAQDHEARRLTEWRKREAKRERAAKAVTYRSDGVMRCSKCPPLHCCADCARINNARQVAGLIHPKGDHRPHPNNCMPCIPRSHSYLGAKPVIYPAPRPSEVISIEVVPLGGGWYEGQALLGLEVIYQRKFRSRDAARRYAVDSMVCIREGLKFEALLNA